MRRHLFLFLFLLINGNLLAQCTCVNCPFNTISNATVTDTIFIAGAANNTLGSGGQDLQKICITFVDDAIEEKEIILESPSGDQVTLAINTGISVGDNITFDICWVACSETAMPDVGFPDVFDTNAGWVDNATYTGCYYPWMGCLEDFTGDVDGPWVLIIEDHIFLDDAIVSNWTLSFYDDTGLNCAEVGPCVYTPPACDANGGELINPPVVACQGDSDLNLSISPSYPGGMAPPMPEYNYTFIVVDVTTDIIVSVSPGTNYTGLNPGNYMVCGLSFLSSQAGLIPGANGTFTYSDMINFVNSGNICGDLSNTCVSVTVEGTGNTPTIMGEPIPCLGAIESYTLNPPLGPGESYMVTVTNGTILSQVGNMVEIEWANVQGNGTLCVTIEGGVCPSPQTCIQVIIDNGFQLPPSIDAANFLCLNSIETAFISGSPLILSYNWTGTGVTITDGQGTNEVQFITNQLGSVQLCLDITTDCGPQGPLCHNITVIEQPVPTVTPNPNSCDFTFTLVGNIMSGNSVSWTLFSGPGNATFNPPFSPTTNVTVTESGMYVFLFIENNGVCHTEVLVPVEVLDGPSIDVPTFNCNLNNEYTVTFTISGGIPPYSVDGIPLAGTTFTSSFIPSGSLYSFVIEDDGGCILTVDGDYICPCQSYAGTVPLVPLEICDSPGQQAIVVSNGDAIFETDDIGVYILHTNPSNILGTILDQNTTGIFSFMPALQYGTTYYISFVVGNDIGGVVDLNDPCLSVSEGQPVTFYQFPAMDVIIPPSICELSFDLDASNIVGVDNYFWSFISGPGTVAFSPIDGIPTTVFVTEPGTYTLSISLFNTACSIDQQFDVEVLPPPEILAIVEDCDPAGGTYTVSFEVYGGTSPYTADIPGTFNGSIFTSDPIPSGDPYIITVSDNNGCMSFPVIGVKLCDCISDSGNMDLNPIELCGEMESAQGMSQNNFVLDSDDIGLYYLHDGDMNVLGAVIDINDTGLFSFQSGMSLDTWYYISFVVGNDNMGEVDQSDPCLDIAIGQPVIWNSIPMVDVGDDITTCFDYVLLSASPSAGQWQSSDANVSFLNSTDPDTEATFSDFGIYNVVWSAANGFCSSSDSIVVTYLSGPSVINVSTDCSDDLLTYIANIEIDGISPPYTVNGDVIAGNVFITQDLSSSEISAFTITDADGCTFLYEVGPINCACQNDAGTINSTDISLCAGDDLIPDISNFDYNLSDTDTVAYVLHQGGGVPFGNIIAISYGDAIMFSGQINAGQTYLLHVVTGQWTGSEIDLNDPCLAISDPVEVVWNAVQNVALNGDGAICQGQQFIFEITSDGPFPFNITLANDLGNEIDVLILQETELIDYVPSELSETWNIVNVDLPCHTLGGNVTINVDEPIFITLITGVTVCNNPIISPIVILEDLFVGDVYPGEWFTPGLTAINGVVSFDDVPAGDYIFTYSTIGFEGACPGTDYNTIITVEDCDCPMLNFGGPISVCNNGQNVMLSDYDVQGWNGNWEVLNPNNLENPILLVGNQVNISGATPGFYTMQFTITDPLLDECDDAFTFDIEVEGAIEAGVAGEILQYCQGSDLAISLFDLINNYQEGGEWFYQGNAISDVLLISDLEPGVFEYTYVIPPGALCPGDQVMGSIEVLPNPILLETLIDVQCFGQEDGSIDIEVENHNGGPYQFSLNSGPSVQQGFFQNLSSGSYNVLVTDVYGCSTQLSNLVLTEPDAFSVDLGTDQLVFIGSSIIINAIASIPTDQIASITWFSNGVPIADESGLQLSLQVFEEQLIDIEIVDLDGCIAIDQMSIKLKQKNVYIPNVFNPNSQVGNESFGLTENSGVEEILQFSIYDRWGNRVFFAEKISPESPQAKWDGKLLGSPVVQGVYVYLMEVRYKNNEVDNFSGDITVLWGK